MYTITSTRVEILLPCGEYGALRSLNVRLDNLYTGHRSWLKEVLTDTGVRYVPKGSLVLYTAGGYEATGLLCAKCSSLTTNVRPWITCGHCWEPLLEVISPVLPPQVLQVN